MSGRIMKCVWPPTGSRGSPAVVLGCFLLCSSFCAPAAAWIFSPGGGQELKPITTEEEALKEVLQPLGKPEREPPPPEKIEGVDECDWKMAGQPIQDKTQEFLRSASCHSFRWFDGLWGDTYDYNENAVSGRMIIGLEWNQYEGFDSRLRFKVRAPTPNMSRRFDLLLGRVDEGAFVSDTQGQDQIFYNPGVVERRDEDSWLLGLGHRRGGGRTGWDWSAGVRLRWPPRPYVKVQYFYNKQFSQFTDLRFRQTFFWRSDDGFGTTSRGDLTHGLSLKNVLRWEGIVTTTQESIGTQWYFGQTWYHLFGGQNAFSLLTFARGETNHEVGLHDIGFKLVWRRPFTRDWLFLSMGPTMTWPREFIEEERELSLGFGLWIEMQFGSWRY